MAARSSTVWMVSRTTGPEGVRGTLELEGDRLVFRPSSGEPESVIALTQVRRARRVRWSPVLELSMHHGAEPPVMGFYFVQPPTLEAVEGRRHPGKRAARRKSAVFLVGSNAAKKGEIKEWVAAIRQRAGVEGP